jgi:hypothetical protein
VAAEYGGGVSNGFGGTVNLQRSVIAGNMAANGREVFNATFGQPGVINANDHNLLGDNSSTNTEAFTDFTPGAMDITATSDGTEPTALAAMLDPTLADNGGPTQTHALPSGSPAVDAAPSGDCQAGTPANGVDQRGLPRNADGDGMNSANECDSGAFERQGDGVISFLHFLPFVAK